MFVLGVALHFPTYSGMDSDFQGYALYSKQIFHGQTPYVDFFSHKPPLYFYLLLPGNFLGGTLFSFFLIHLAIVGSVGVLIFIYGSRLTKIKDYRMGAWAWLLFHSIEVSQFLNYGTLNGSIVYPTMGMGFMVFIFSMEIKNRVIAKDKGLIPLTIAAGFLSGASLFTRFGVEHNFIFVAVIGFLLLIKKANWKQSALLLILYGIGVATFSIIMLAVIGFPLQEMFEDLIVFNRNYLRLPAEVTPNYIIHLLERISNAVKTFIEFAFIPSLICLIAIFAWIATKPTPKAIITFLKDDVIFWLLLYLCVELVSVGFQGGGKKIYIYFPPFIPICLLASYSIQTFNKLLNYPVHFSKIITSLLLVLMYVEYNEGVDKSMYNINLVRKWPESELIAEIKKYSELKNDLFTIDFRAYIYLETNMLPPIEHNNYYSPTWNLYSKNGLERENKILTRLEQFSPRVVTINPDWPRPANDRIHSFLSNYKKYGTYQTSYSGRTSLYVWDVYPRIQRYTGQTYNADHPRNRTKD